MNKLSLKVFISIFFALISISIFSYNVSADGGEIPVIETPPPTEIVSEETITVVEPLVTQVVEDVFSATEVSVEITEIPTDSPIATITSEATPVPSESITEVPEEAALGEISESKSESETITGSLSEADVVLSDENGNALTLATSATAQAISSADPWFIVGTKKYAYIKTGGTCPTGTSIAGGNCTESSTPIEAAINAVAGGLIPTDKKIYVEYDSTAYSDVVSIDGTSDPSLKQLIGLIGVANLDGEFPSLSHGVTISNLVSGFTLSGFNIAGGVVFSNNSGTVTIKDVNVVNATGTGISITNQSGAVVLNGVVSSGNQDSGAVITNNTSTTAYNVTINNSEFNSNDSDSDNDGYGILVDSKGAVSANLVTASNNSGSGMTIRTNGAVSVKNSSFFNNAYVDDLELLYGNGLHIVEKSSGAVNLETIYANWNDGDGIVVESRGGVTAKFINAEGNLEGMAVNEYFDSVAYYPSSVTISDSVFNANNSAGLYIRSKGNILLSFVNANDNTGDGVYLDSCLQSGGICVGNGIVTVSNPYPMVATFNGNGGSGLYIKAAGAVTITGISASNNDSSSGGGLVIFNNYPGKVDGVTINVITPTDSSTTHTEFSGNAGYGIRISTNGPVAINGNTTWPIEINNNKTAGIIIGWDSSNYAGSTVLLKGITLRDNYDFGVKVFNKGTITITNVNVNNHWQNGYGFYLYNNVTGSTGSVSITNSTSSYNGSYGYCISSFGSVTLKNTTAHHNTYEGIYISNENALTAQSVTLSDVIVFSTIGWGNSGGNGIDILTKGKVTLNGVSSYNNSGKDLTGSYRSVHGWAGDQTWFKFIADASNNDVEVIFTSLDGSFTIRLLKSDGTILDTQTTTEGEILEIAKNSLDSGVYFITVDWVDSLYHEYSLDFTMEGSTGSTIQDNISTGIKVTNTAGTSDIVIGGSTTHLRNLVENNSGAGLDVITNGNISLVKTDVNKNHGNNITLTNSTSTIAKTVTLSSITSTYSQNAGITIESWGAVSMTDLVSTNNNGYGVYVNNCQLTSNACKGAAAVTLNGTSNLIQSNSETGIFINTIGLVTLNNLSMENNSSHGLYITAPSLFDLIATPTTGGVTLTSSGTFTNTSRYNGGYGVYVYTYGTVNLANLTSNNNMNVGLLVNNENATTAKSITLTDVEVYNNQGIGVDIDSKGTVALKGVSSYSNYYFSPTVTMGTTIKGVAAGSLALSVNVPSTGFSLTIEILSDNFYGQLMLLDSSSQMVANDFNNTPGESLSIDHYVDTDEEGTYTIMVIPYQDGPFDYILAVEDTSGVDSNYNYAFAGIDIDNSGFGTGNVTISKTTKTPAPYASYNTGKGLEIKTNGSISISNFKTNKNYTDGIHAVTSGTTKSATLTNITSNENFGYGVSVNAPAGVTWTSGIVKNNNNYGVNIRSIGAVNLTNLLVRGNSGPGIDVNTEGAICLTGVTSQFNYHEGIATDYGAQLTNTGSTSLIKSGITITDSNFSYNSSGLFVDSLGIVQLLGVVVEGNYNHGQDITSLLTATYKTLHNFLPGYTFVSDPDFGTYIGGGVSNWLLELDPASSLSFTFTPFGFVGKVTLFNSNGTEIVSSGDVLNGVTSSFSASGLDGEYTLRVETLSGDIGGDYAITLNDPTQYLRYTYTTSGVYITTIADVIVGKGISITSNNISENAGEGLHIGVSGANSNGNITVSDVTIRENFYNGLYISNYPSLATLVKTITFTNVDLLNNVYQNVAYYANGPFSWVNGKSDGSANGAFFNNSNGPSTASHSMSFTNVYFTDSRENDGVNIYNKGNVNFKNVEATGNALVGANINNYYSGNGTGSVVINNTSTRVFSNNGATGLRILSKGNVKITNGDADQNGTDGVSIDNAYGTGYVTVLNTKTISYDGNDGDGLYIHSKGSITLTDVQACYNGSQGVIAQNDESTTGGTITYTQTKALSNDYNFTGFELASVNAIILTNVQANHNNHYGLVATNYNSTALAPITIIYTIDASISDNLANEGMFIQSKGNVKITTPKTLNVSRNGGTGIQVDNHFSFTTNASLTVSGGKINVENNGGYGLLTMCYGSEVVNNVRASGNVQTGIQITGIYSNYATSVVMNNIASINNGTDTVDADGIYIHSSGPVTLYNIYSENNTKQGLEISSGGVTTVKKAILTRNGDGTGYYGLNITAQGNIILDSILSTYNDRNLYLNNHSVTTKGNITLLSTLYKNEFNGAVVTTGNSINIYSGGILNLTNFDVKSNAGSINMSADGVTTLSNSSITNNAYGLALEAYGNVTLSKVVSANNGYWDATANGVYDPLSNNSDGFNINFNADGNVSFTNCSIYGNSGSGIEIDKNTYTVTVSIPSSNFYFGNDTDQTGDLNKSIHS